MIVIVVDNRSMAYQSFHIEAAHTSYFRNVTTFIGQFYAISEMYTWLHKTILLGIAMSPEKVRFVQPSDWSVSTLPTLFVPRYSSVGAQKSTWGLYFSDAINKVSNMPRGSDPVTLLLYSTDFSLFGERPAVNLDDDIDKFSAACVNFQQKHPDGTITILCVIASESTNADHYYSSPNLVKVQLKLSTLATIVKFKGLKNTQFHFGQDLQKFISSFSFPLHCKLDMPSNGGATCSLILELCASTGAARGAMHNGLCEPCLCTLCPRVGIDPHYLEGNGLHVTCPTDGAAIDLLPTENSRKYNALTVYSLAKWLEAHDLVAILRVVHRLDEGGGTEDPISNMQYWVLIPPASCALKVEDPFFVLLQLSDHDDILTPPTYHVTADDSPACAITLAKTDSQRATDLNVLDDIHDYLESSLIPFLGPPEPYEPTKYLSGSANAMFEDQRRAHLHNTGRSIASASTTTGQTPATSVSNTTRTALTYTTKPGSSITSNRKAPTSAPRATTRTQPHRQPVQTTCRPSVLAARPTPAKKRLIDTHFTSNLGGDGMDSEDIPVIAVTNHTLPKRAPKANTAPALARSEECWEEDTPAGTSKALYPSHLVPPTIPAPHGDAPTATAVVHSMAPKTSTVEPPVPRYFKRKFGGAA